MLHEKFHGNEQALQKAIADGDVVVTTHKGKDFLSYSTLKSGRKKEHHDESQLDDGEHMLDDATHCTINDWMQRLSLGMFALENSPSQKKDPNVVVYKKQETDWNKVEKIIQQAKQAQEKLIRDGMKLKEKVLKAGDQELLQVFKGCLNVLQENERNLDHICLWKDTWGLSCSLVWALLLLVLVIPLFHLWYSIVHTVSSL